MVHFKREVLGLRQPRITTEATYLLRFKVFHLQEVGKPVVPFFRSLFFGVSFHIPAVPDTPPIFSCFVNKSAPESKNATDHTVTTFCKGQEAENSLYFADFEGEELEIRTTTLPMALRVMAWQSNRMLWVEDQDSCLGMGTVSMRQIESHVNSEVAVPIFETDFVQPGIEPSGLVSVTFNIICSPPPPRDFQALDISRNSCRFVWKPPPDGGGGVIFGYKLYLALSRGPEYMVPAREFIEIPLDDSARVFSKTIRDLRGNRDYVAQLYSVNECGRGNEPATIRFKSGPDAPKEPSIPRLVYKTKRKDAVEIEWDAPRDTGGGEIIAYRMYMEKRIGRFFPESSGWIDMGAMALDTHELKKPNDDPAIPRLFGTTVGNLEQEASYRFRVQAINHAGAGELSPAGEFIRL